MKHDYIKLKIWHKARSLNKDIYKISLSFPKEERFGLTNQVRRASVSVVSNIAEGSGYESNAQFLKFLSISLGSLCELETQCYVALDLNYINEEQLDNVISNTDELKRMLLKFITNMKSRNKLDINISPIYLIFLLLI